MAKAKLSAANAVILGAGIVMLLGSFLAFFAGVDGLNIDVTAWSRGLFGIATVVVFCGVTMASQVAFATFGTRPPPGKPFGLTWDQVHLALGFQAAVMMLAFYVQNRPSFLKPGVGFWLMLASAIALFVGALLRLRRPRRGLRSI
jgi:hypothetical protein